MKFNVTLLRRLCACVCDGGKQRRVADEQVNTSGMVSKTYEHEKKGGQQEPGTKAKILNQSKMCSEVQLQPKTRARTTAIRQQNEKRELHTTHI